MRSAPDSIFAALADPTRRAIFERLCSRGELTVSALTEMAGVSQPAVSKHLRLLKAAGLAQDRPDGRQTFYRAVPRGLKPVMNWMQFYAKFWDDRLDRLETLLKRMDQ
jgi:DNA-binding transcriptional ArsR family regulator